MYAQFDNNPPINSISKGATDTSFSASMPSSIMVKAKLEMTQPSDAEEQEAEAVADSIVNEGRIARAVSNGNSGEGLALSSSFGNKLSALQGQGSRLYGGLKEKMESGFGRDFSNVRLHTDDAAAEMSSSISAKAFTLGNDIYFNRGQYNPESQAGQHLIAHELTHVAQGTGKLARERNYSSVYMDYTPQTSSQEVYSFLSSLSVNTQQQIQDPQSPRHTAIGNATKNNLNGYHPEGITVAFILSNGDDHNGAFSIIDKRYHNIKDRLYAFHPSSANDIINILEVCKMYGPLQNVIIAGHGEWDSIAMAGSFELSIDHNSPNYNGTIRIFNKINESLAYGRSLNPNLKQSIYLNACLTNSHVHDIYNGYSRMNFSEILRRHINGDVTIWANSASAVVGHLNYSSDGSGSLHVTDPHDHPSVLRDIYEGGELIDGRPRRTADDWIGVNRDISRLKMQVTQIRDDYRMYGDIFDHTVTVGDGLNEIIRMRGVQYLTFVLRAIDVISSYDPTIQDQMNDNACVIADFLYGLSLIEIEGDQGDPDSIIADVIDRIKDIELKNRLMRLYNADQSLRMSISL